MPQRTRIHAVVRHDQLQRDEWYLVRDPEGKRYVLFETLDLAVASDKPDRCYKREVPVQTILAQNNELSRKLRSILEM